MSDRRWTFNEWLAWKDALENKVREALAEARAEQPEHFERVIDERISEWHPGQGLEVCIHDLARVCELYDADPRELARRWLHEGRAAIEAASKTYFDAHPPYST
jgi:hypothetical protein